ncbi:hypothetical protein NQD34_004304 [Periophthalmus magnuspinnatus]|nr:hypothetical protein NQD34_004304 [Periophthalmus magnuspinnatus]
MLTKAIFPYWRFIVTVMTPLVLLPLPLVIRTKEAECAFVLLVMALLWVTEAMPLAITAMLPAFLFPLFGIMKSSQVASVYFKDFHFLLIGVICLATSIEKWGLHRRIALRLVTLVGVNPAWLMLGFMTGCAFLSMWVHNTSAVAMVMPIVEAVLQQILKTSTERDSGGEDNPNLQLDEPDNHVQIKETSCEKQNVDAPEVNPKACHINISEASSDQAKAGHKVDHMLCKAICLSIAYSSNIGGISTLLGTSPNLIFSEYLHQMYPECNSVNFGNWLLLCLPISVIMLLLTWAWLYWLFIGSDFSFLWKCGGQQSEKEKAARNVLEEEYKTLGPMSPQEIFTTIIFISMVLLWFTRDPGFIPGWASLFPEQNSGYITDATVALLLGVVFFIVPAHGPYKKYDTMISWREFQASMPWTVALLVGGGFALAEGTKESGLSTWVAELLTPLGDLPVLATITVACIIVTSLTEVASNAATITIFLPILSPLAEAIHVNPLYVMIPATLCTSFSFLLPVSNPPNAVVFAYGHLHVKDMVKAGLGVNVIGVLCVMLAIVAWGVPLFSLDTYPEWAPVLPTFNSTAP